MLAVGAHRLILNSEDGSRKEDLLQAIVHQVPVPRD